MVAIASTIFPRIIAEVEWGGGGDFYFYFCSKGGDYSKESNYLTEPFFQNLIHEHELLKYMNCWKLWTDYFALLSHYLSKLIT